MDKIKSRTKDLTGKKFGKLKVIAFSGYHQDFEGNTVSKTARWVCRCDCGTVKIVRARVLLNGHSRSCGCYKTSLLEAGMYRTHGMSHDIKYRRYRNMLDRCHNSNHRDYKYYGGRGIKVCARWKGKAGLEHYLNDMGERPEGKALGRKNINGGYNPDNCRWVTPKEQCNNKRNNITVEYNGKKQSLSQWADQTGILRSVLYGRLKMGWSAKKTLTSSVRERSKNK